MKITIVVTVLLQLVLTGGKKFTLEAEKYAIQRQRVMQRSNAFSKNTVWMHKGERLKLEFCLEKHSSVQIVGIRYSNDGPHDTINVSIDDHIIGTFISEPRPHEGFEWNVFHTSGEVGIAKSLSAGRHFITTDLASSDNFGVELDAVILDINDSELEEETFRCTLYCFDDIDYSDAARRDDVASAKFVQQSYRTLCTEEKNVRIDIYHEEADKFRITAMPPKYKTYSNKREPDLSSCASDNPIWEFKDILLRESKRKLQTQGAVALISGGLTKMHILITFTTPGLSADRNKMNHGNMIHMKLKNIRSTINVSLAYAGKSGLWYFSKTKAFTIYQSELTWELDNISWSQANSNLMQIMFYSSDFRNTTIEELRLSSEITKQKAKEMPFSIFQNGDFIIEGVNIIPWWLGRRSMSIRRLDNGQSFKNVECVRTYLKEPWSDGYSKIFNLCQDGCMQLLPVTPHGLDWIPFGSTIIVGQSNPKDKNPYAAISDIDIDPERLKFKLNFQDQTSMILEIEPSRFETSVKVTEYKYAKDRKKFPALTFKSMWVANGRSDVDHMTINGDEARPIMTDTGPLHGISAVFFRKCISSHNTLSPDLKIEVLGNGD